MTDSIRRAVAAPDRKSSMYRTIMVPLDGSSFAENALPLAVGLSMKTGSELHLATVVEGSTSLSLEGWEEAARANAADYLEDVVGRLVEDGYRGDVTTSVISGDATVMLGSESLKRGADLVVMASHGHGALTRMWMGSVADGFVRHATIPVIVVRAEEGEPAPPILKSLGTILIPLDGSDLAEDALRYATDFGELFGRAYHLTRVVSYPLELATPYLPHTAQLNEEVFAESRRAAAEYLESRADRMRARGHRVTTSVAVAVQAAQGILDEAAAVGADMLAMSTHGNGGLRRAVLGSTADKVMRGADVPVLLHRYTEGDTAP